VATFLILRIIHQDIVKCSYAFMLSSCSSCQILLKLEFSQHIFLSIKYQISLKSVHWDPSCTMQTDSHDKADSKFSNFADIPG